MGALPDMNFYGLADGRLGPHARIGLDLGKLVDKKNAAYGSAFSKCQDFLRLLYPDGVKPEQYKDMLTLVRIFDKIVRIATDKGAFGENPYSDIGGYALLALREAEYQKARAEPEEPMASYVTEPKEALDRLLDQIAKEEEGYAAGV